MLLRIMRPEAFRLERDAEAGYEDTISGPQKNQRGAFIELTWGGAEPVAVGDAKRTFLEDGDEIVISATAPGAAGGRIGFGEVRGRIAPAR